MKTDAQRAAEASQKLIASQMANIKDGNATMRSILITLESVSYNLRIVEAEFEVRA